MDMTIRCLALSIIAAFSVAALPAAEGVAIKPGQVWPDDKGVHINAHGGGILKHEGVYYWFGEHKIEGKKGNYAHVGVHVYSSTDLGHWTDRGVALAVSEDPASEITKGCILERPKVIYNAKTQTFAMWFHLEFKSDDVKTRYSTARTALAVSKSITGPYTYVKSFRPNAGVWPQAVTADDQGKVTLTPTNEKTEFAFDKYLRRDLAGGQMSRDMTLYVDDDQRAYLVGSSEENRTLHISQLTDDYQGFSGKWARILPEGWNEAPAFFKRNGSYYLITSGCTGWRPNAARSAKAPSIWGPWQPLNNPCRGTEKQVSRTFEGQSTFILPMPGTKDGFLFMGDLWKPDNAIDGRYLWLPIGWEGDQPTLTWQDEWRLPTN
jgi:hypothetical protein